MVGEKWWWLINGNIGLMENSHGRIDWVLMGQMFTEVKKRLYRVNSYTIARV